ncbi:ATP-binding protein [Sporosarcina sp. resist]|uniref:ATP-binding protein n=1 Tax=Sporosarcina sp. resist TaxID=2762563 RepID=UPI00164EBB8C|nr:ATP-binding protein [Sporosarcina sp. resist]QNK88698.1 ATP-binding protein [Sporosarcina sp. resist]
MVNISFIIKPLIGKLSVFISGKLIEQWKIKWKLNNMIKTFKREYEDTFVDSNAFQKFLNDEKNGLLIFNYVFGATYSSITKVAFIEQLSKLAINEINLYRKSVKLEEIDNHLVVNQYLYDLITYLEEYRDKSFKLSEKNILANVQTSIEESNESLKEYFKRNLLEIQEKAYLEKYTDIYLEKILDRNIMDLGKRYISEANVETNFNEIFDSLVSNKQIFQHFSEVLGKLQMSIMEFSEAFIKYKEVLGYDNINFIEKIIYYLKEINCEDKEFYLRSSMNNLSDEISGFMAEVEGLRYKLYEEEKKSVREELNSPIHKINKYERELNDYIDLVMPMLINEPYLLIYGDAGIGKSHLLADNAKRLQEDGHSVFLFLGQHLNTHDHPFKQLFDLIDYKGSKEYFLKEFNDRANKKNKRTVIIIDALNEGEGKYFWKNFLVNFLNSIKEFKDIAVVLSVRSNYVRSILPENIETDFPLHKLEHKGFKSLSLDALEPFFNYYNINPLVFPSLENECYNPLFLHIYCEVFQEEYVGYRGWSIVEVLERYIGKINSRLSLDQRFSYTKSLNLVDKILKEIAAKFIENKSHLIKLDELYEIIYSTASPYTIGYRELVLGLEEENILSINSGYHGESLVYFTYERFSDIYISLVLLDRYRQDKKMFGEMLASDNAISYGVYESLSIIVPEKLNVELLDLVDSKLITFDLAESFVRGISWRNVQNIDERTLYWINLCLKQENIDLQSLVYENLLKQSYIIESPLNAKFLHDNINPIAMSIRDGSWTISINNNSEVPNQLVEIILDQNLSFRHFKYENFELLSLSIIWLFTSTDRKLRDISTIALVKLYMIEPSIILKNINMFINVNDPYVLERLLASAYGAILRTNEVPNLEEIIDIIYTEIFEQEEVYPNVLVRDYARGIILFAANKGIISPEEYEKITPPYSSNWYGNNYTLQDVDKKLSEMQEVAKNKFGGFHRIIRSMTTEYGRRTGAYGDFGRYVFGSTLYEWKNQFNDQDLSNIATMRVIDFGYDEKIHGYYDSNLGYYNRHENLVERIGKKYQWIALYELLAKLTDNYPVYKEINLYTLEYQKYKEKQNNRIFSDMSEFLKSLSDEDTELPVEGIEEPLNEEEHFLGIKKEYYKKYNGPWDPFLRNIDPSLLEYPTKNENSNLVKNYLPYRSNKMWAQNEDEFNTLDDFIFIEYEGNKYVSLAQLLVQKREDSKKFVDRDEFCIKSKAVFLPNMDKQKYISLKTEKKGDMSVSWANTYSIFAFEHYWHPSFKDMFYKNEFENIECEDAIWEYLWETNINPASGERTSCSYLLPNADLVRFFNLRQITEGTWKDIEDNLVAFDAQYMGYESNLLFRADYLEKYLRENNLTLVWDFYMEKISERSRKEEWFICWTVNGTDIKHTILDQYKELEMEDRY